jgi:RNA recognition motif-containing protein
MFSAYGQVTTAVIIRDEKNGRSTGRAYIIMPNDEQAREAIASLDQKLIDGQRVAISEVTFSLGQCNN